MARNALRFAGAAALVFALGAAPCRAQSPCFAQLSCFPPQMVPVPRAPAPGDPTSLAIFDARRSGSPRVVVRQMAPVQRKVAVTVTPLATPSHALLDVSLDGMRGLAEGTYSAEYYDDPPSGPTPEPRLTLRFVVAPPVIMVEYFNVALGHYFITGDPAEIAKLDSGEIAGWQRTGESFAALGTEDLPSFALPVCRYYGLPAAGLDTHFYSESRAECASVLARWPDRWVLETDRAFAVIGSVFPFECDNPVFRLYNNRPDANHRYTTSPQVRDAMIAEGWTREDRAVDDPYSEPYSFCAAGR